MIPAYNPPPRPEIEHNLSAGERLANLSRDKVDNVCDAQVVLLREKKLVAFIYKRERMHVTLELLAVAARLPLPGGNLAVPGKADEA